MKWQPIETAPRDGTPIILCRTRQIVTKEGTRIDMLSGENTMVGEWDGGMESFVVSLSSLLEIAGETKMVLRAGLVCEWTYWMPLPPPPEE